MHSSLEDVGLPCGLHDGEWADDECPFYLPDVHQVVSSPDGGGGFASPGFVEAERSASERQERGCVLLVIKRLEHTRPVVVPQDGGQYVRHIRVGLRLIKYVSERCRFVVIPVHDYVFTSAKILNNLAPIN